MHQRLDPSDFFPYMPARRLRLRSQHSLELLHNRSKLGLEDVVQLKFSPRMLLADRIRDDLVSAVNAIEGASEELLGAAGLLAEWDGTVRRESRGAVLFEIWWGEYAKSTTRVNDP